MKAWAAVEVALEKLRKLRGPGGQVWQALEAADELVRALDDYAAVRPRVFDVKRPESE